MKKPKEGIPHISIKNNGRKQNQYFAVQDGQVTKIEIGNQNLQDAFNRFNAHRKEERLCKH